MERSFSFLDGSEQPSRSAAQNRRENRKIFPPSWSTRAFTVGGGGISLGSDRGLNQPRNAQAGVLVLEAGEGQSRSVNEACRLSLVVTKRARERRNFSPDSITNRTLVACDKTKLCFQPKEGSPPGLSYAILIFSVSNRPYSANIWIQEHPLQEVFGARLI